MNGPTPTLVDGDEYLRVLEDAESEALALFKRVRTLEATLRQIAELPGERVHEAPVLAKRGLARAPLEGRLREEWTT